MKILYIAFACDPYAGSEAQVGWSWAVSMRRYADVYLITRNENKKSIEKYIDENKINDIHVFYHDVPIWMNIYYKSGRFYHLFYMIWQKTLSSTVKKLNKIYDFDYIHHVSLGDFRSVSSVWKLSPEFIFGPVGGAQLTPDVFKPYIESTGNETIRKWINCITGLNPTYRRALNGCSRVFAANKETCAFLKQRMKDKEKCILLTENGIQETKLDMRKKNNKKIVVLWAGRMVKRKGLSFLLDTVKKIETDIPFVIKLAGDGPEKNELMHMAEKMRIEDKIHFLGKLAYNEMRQLYCESDIFVFPSFRETTGTVLFEAMSAAMPVVTFNQNGAALLIDDECGIKVNIDQPLSNIISDFSESLKKLIEDPDLRAEMGYAAYTKIKNEYTWERKCSMFYNEYLKGI